jgi:DNA-binding IclR family transcriptional regulator
VASRPSQADAKDADDASARRGDSVQSVERAFQLLAALVEAREPRSALELARVTGLNRTVAYRLLRTLQSLGAVTESNGEFGLGDRLAQLGYAYLERLPFRRAALMYLIDLHVGLIDKPWVTSLAIPAADHAVLVDRLWGKNTPLNAILDVGTRLDLDHSAAGRSMLSCMNEATAIQLIGPRRYRGVAKELAQARADGYAITKNELGPGIVAVAASVCDATGRPVGAVSIAGVEDGVLGVDTSISQQLRRVTLNIERVLTA